MEDEPHVKYDSIHNIVLKAFPSSRLDNMGLPCGVQAFKDHGPRPVMGTGMYSEVQYTCFDIVRDLGLRILHKLALEIAHDSERAQTIYVKDVLKALRKLGHPQSLELTDGSGLPSCPSVNTIKRGRAAPGGGRKQGSSRQQLIDAQSQMFAQLKAQEDARPQPVGGDRGATRRTLIAVSKGAPSDCLYLPDKYFALLTRWIFTGVEGQAPTMTPGARALIQHAVEQSLMWIIESSWEGMQGYTGRSSLTAHDILVMMEILRKRAEILRGELPEYPGLDELEEELLHKQRSRGRGGSVRGRSSRGRGAERRRSRSPPGPDPDSNAETSGSE